VTGVIPQGTPGIRFGQAAGLVDEALALLEKEPRSSAVLAQRVLGVAAGPTELASELVRTLFRDQPGVRQHDGVWYLAEPPEAAPIPLDEVRFTVVDVETTGGLAEQGGKIVEVAAVEVQGGEVIDSFATLVDPGVRITPWVVKLTGIADRMVSGAPRFDEICDELRERLEGRVFVAHNVSYDWRFLGAEMRRARAVMPRGPRLCTMQLARRLLPGLTRRGLDSLADYYGVEIVERHRARGDAIATARILIHLLAEADRRGISTWPALRQWLSTPPGAKRRGANGEPQTAACDGRSPPC
jgi:DNA polymerase III epsilon subunit family exonuclease